MQSKLNVLALAGLAAAAAPAYEASSSVAAVAYPSSSVAAVAYSSEVAAPAYSSEAAAPAYGSSSYASYYPSSAAGYYGASSSAVVSAFPSASASGYPACWSSCFAAAGITSEEALCGNTEVDECIQEECSGEADEEYWAWYDSYCPAVTSTASSYVYTTPSITGYTATASASASGYPECWAECFAEYDISSEAALCGNTEVDQCIQESCSSSADEEYWSWYDSYCTTTVTSVETTSTPCPTSAVYESTNAYTTETATGYWTSSVATGSAATGSAASGTWAASGTGAYASASPSASWVPATGAGVAVTPAAGLFVGLLAVVALL